MDQVFSLIIPEDKSHTIMCSGFATCERNRFCSVPFIHISLLGIFYLHSLVKEASVFSHFVRLTCLYMAGHSIASRGACGWFIKNTLEC